MIDKNKYILAKANGLEERFRGDEISKNISQGNVSNADEELQKGVPISAQIALLMDMIDLICDVLQIIPPKKYSDYQLFRKSAKAEVDAEISEME
jgi:hypothetical protein